MNNLSELLYCNDDFIKEKSAMILDIQNKVLSRELSKNDALELLNDIKNSDELINLSCEIKLKDLLVKGLEMAISSMNF